MFQVGDKIVHPMHGAGIIKEIVEKKIDGVNRSYYSLNLPVGGMIVLIPTDHTTDIGMRPIIESQEADEVFHALTNMKIDADENWNRRYRENMVRLKSGDLIEVARVMKTLILREEKKTLSSGERKMLQSAKQIFYSEIVLSQDCTYEDVEARVDKALV